MEGREQGVGSRRVIVECGVCGDVGDVEIVGSVILPTIKILSFVFCDGLDSNTSRGLNVLSDVSSKHTLRWA